MGKPGITSIQELNSPGYRAESITIMSPDFTPHSLK
jgi:hypothetical protein